MGRGGRGPGKGLALDPDRPELWMACGNSWANAGRSERALQAYDRVLTLDPRCAQAWSARGGVHREQGRLAEAAECFERAIALGADPTLQGYFLAVARGDTTPAAPCTRASAPPR